MKKMGVLLALWTVVFGLNAPGYAQAPMPPVIIGPPDVLVIVYQVPGGADQVGITYAHAVPAPQAAQDMQALAQVTGWPVGASRIKNAASPVKSRPGMMTSVVFQVPNVVQDSTHTLPVDVFARAFHNDRRVNVVFFVGPLFQFQGSRSYADKDIKMVLDQRGTTYTYLIEILNPRFGRLAPAALSPATGIGAHARSPWGMFLIIFGTAAAAGLIVYFLMVRLSPPPGPKFVERTAEDETRQEAEIRR